MINQAKDLLAGYDIVIEFGYQEFRIRGAIYETERVEHNREINYLCHCRYTMPHDRHITFLTNGGNKHIKEASMRLATFRCLKKIITTLFGFNWEKS